MRLACCILLGLSLCCAAVPVLGQEEVPHAQLLQWNSEAVAAYRAGDFASAAAAAAPLLKALRTIRSPDDPDLQGVINLLGLSYYQQGRYAEAIALFEEALASRRRTLPANDPGIAAGLNNLAQLHQLEGRFGEAERLFNEALAVWRATLPEDHPDVLAGIGNLAGLYWDLGRYAEAEPLLRQVLEIRRASLPQGHLDIALSLNNLAELYRSQGRYERAGPLHQEALAIRRAALPESHPNIAQSLNNLALLYQDQGRYEAAESLLTEALAIYRAALRHDHPTIAWNLGNLAHLYQRQGRFAAAEPLFEEALSILRAALPRDHPEIADSLNELALLYQDQGRPRLAEPLYGEALAIRRRVLPAGHRDIAQSLNNLANLHYLQGRLDLAEPMMAEALEIWRAALPAGHPNVARAINNLAEVYRSLGRLDEAEPLMEEALGLWRAALPANHPDIAASLSNLAELYRLQGRLGQAEHALSEALAIWHAVLPADHPSIAVGLNNLGWLQLDQGRTDLAANSLGRAVAIYSGTGNRPQIAAASYTFRKHAEAALKAAVSEETAEGSGGSTMPGSAFSSLQWPNLGAAGDALHAAHLRRSGGDSTLDAVARERDRLLEDFQAVKRLYVDALSRLDRDEGSAAFTALEARYDNLRLSLQESEARLTEAFPAYAELTLPQPLNLEQAQALLGPDEALVTYLLGEPSLAMLVTSEGIDWAFLPDGTTLIDKARQLRCQAAISDAACHALSDRGETRQPMELADPDAALQGPSFDLALSHALYRDLLGPFEEALAGKSHLIIAPDGRLMGFPFQLLLAAPPAEGLAGDAAYRAAPWLIRDMAISVLPTVSSLRALRQLGEDLPAAAQPFIGFGDPVIGSGDAMVCPPRELLVASLDLSSKNLRTAAGVTAEVLFRSSVFDGGIALADIEALRALTRLPDTRCEVEAVADALRAGEDAIYLDQAATESQVKALSEQGLLDDYRVLLFATHGLVAGEAGAAEPGLVLTPPDVATLEDDGILTASEVAGLKLNADWVILSACNTAAGADPNAESLSGLAKAFFYAGAESLLVSHWPVYSASTVELVTATMDRLAADPGLSRAEALRQAMLAFLERPDLDPHPAHWAPFSLVGEGGVTSSLHDAKRKV